MQFMLVPAAPQALAPGHLAAALPGVFAGHRLWLHTLEPGARAEWPAGAGVALLVLTDGLGKAAIDGAAQRIGAPGVLRPPAGAALRITNQGPTPMRLLACIPHGDAPPPVAGPGA